MASAKARPTHDLPTDLLIAIIHRLPVKSLLRFKSVSKSWYNLIQTPLFISKHLHHRTTTTTHGGVSPFLFLNETLDRVSLLHEHTLSIAVDFNIPSSIKSKLKGFWDIVGSCNGLILVSDSEIFGSGIILWNPSIRKLWRLPTPLISSNCDGLVRGGVAFGFGSDPEDPMEYKLVRIVYFRGDPNQQEKELVVYAEIYTQSSDSWRLIDAANTMPCVYSSKSGCFSPYLIRTSRSEAVVDGILHWKACVDEGCVQETIIAFDFRTESFREIPLPASNTVANDHFISLVVFEGCLGVVIIPLEYDGNGNGTFFDVWVMKEYGNPNSWSKQFVMGPFWEPPLKLVGCWRNGEIIIQKDLNELLLYEPNTRLTKRIPISGVSCNCTYKESLGPVRRRDAT